MPGDGRPAGFAIHGSAVAIGARALVIIGASGAGKSALAAALVTASTPHRPIVLIGDDRILLLPDGDGRLIARPHPRIAGFIERRGLGLVASRFRAQARVAAVVDLDGATTRPGALRHFPVMSLASVADAVHRRNEVLNWRDPFRAAA